MFARGAIFLLTQSPTALAPPLSDRKKKKKNTAHTSYSCQAAIAAEAHEKLFQESHAGCSA